jgi:hypothetical protein
MVFQPESIRGASAQGQVTGQVDFRLARNAVLRDLRRGRLSRLEVCDAHPELLRAAQGVGQVTSEDCPVCGEDKIRLVSYAFGRGLPAGGRCVSSRLELARLSRGTRSLACYVVEVCPTCAWNHLARLFNLGGRGRQA